MSSLQERMAPNVSFDCETCGKHVEKYVIPSAMRKWPPRFCDRTCAGAWRKGKNHPLWKGGRYYDSQGYVYVAAPDHPLANAAGAVFEHRLIMEAHVGRYLTREEVVHHENDVQDDNRIENLRLFATQADHKRYHDLSRVRDEKGRYVPVAA